MDIIFALAVIAALSLYTVLLYRHLKSLREQLAEAREEHLACYAALKKKAATVNLMTLDLTSATKCIEMQRQNAQIRDQQLAQSESTVQTMAAEIKSLTSHLKDLEARANRDRQRLEWLHSPDSNNVDGWDWGIYKVQWQQGQPVRVLATNADFSDLDYAITTTQEVLHVQV